VGESRKDISGLSPRIRWLAVTGRSHIFSVARGIHLLAGCDVGVAVACDCWEAVTMLATGGEPEAVDHDELECNIDYH